MVLATDRYAAADGAALVEVDYEELPAIVDPKQVDGRRRADHPRGHRRQEGSRPRPAHPPEPHLHLGGRRQGRAPTRPSPNAAVTVREEILNPRVHPCPLETCGCVASFNKATGYLTVYMTTQVPHLVRTVLAMLSGVAESKIRVDRRRHRRRLRQQGAGVSGLRGRDRRVDRHRRADQVDRVAHRQHLDHRLRARLPRRRRTGRRQGRPHQGPALHRAGRPRRVQFACLGDQAAGRAVLDLHRLVRHPQRLLPGRRGLHQQGARRRRLPLFAARDRGGLPDRADDRRAGAEARHRQGRDPAPQLRQGRAVPVHHVVRLDAGQRRLRAGARQGAEGGRLRRPAARAGGQARRPEVARR